MMMCIIMLVFGLFNTWKWQEIITRLLKQPTGGTRGKTRQDLATGGKEQVEWSGRPDRAPSEIHGSLRLINS
ncbi:hypothetical protein BJX64DRAFT_241179 [Aspergillus heterothallicus]